MPTVTKLILVAHTRSDSAAGSDNFLRIFSDGAEIAVMGKPPGPGLAYHLEGDTVVELDQLLNSQISLGVTGRDAWGPRSVFLLALVEKPAPNYVPIAHVLTPGYFDTKGKWGSQDLSEGRDRWQLNVLKPAGADDLLSTFVIVSHAEPFGAPDTGSTGSIHFSLYAEISRLPILVLNSPLPKLGRIHPGVRNFTYMAALRTWHYDPMDNAPFSLGFPASVLRAAHFRNLSEDAWRPDLLAVFGLNERRGIARLLTASTGPFWWTSQEPTDSADAGFGFGAADSIMLPILA